MVRKPTHSRGFTITELLVAIGTIIVLLGILLPALALVRTQAGMAESESNLKQVATWMRMYSTDNREQIVPSTFNYSTAAYQGHVRSAPTVQYGAPNMGTWTDILWTVYGNYSFPQLADAPGAAGQIGHDYSTDSPDSYFYDFLPGHSENPFRSAAPNGIVPGGAVGALPYGDGIKDEERGTPGYFAANDFFNADPSSPVFSGWFVTGQIRAPSRSLYAVDSFYGEIIDALPRPWDVEGGAQEVEFRYADSCLMLMLDGSVKPEGKWASLSDLEYKRRIRVTNLTQNEPSSLVPPPQP
jgi:type II secretory pathway pseudopilin PulG